MKAVTLDYTRFFEMSPDLLCIAGYDGYFRKVNPSVSKLLGYSQEELYARPINDFVYEEDKKATSESRKFVTESNTLFNFENRYRKKNGDIVWLAWTSQPIDDERLVFAIAKDITEKKRLESQRLALLDDLIRMNEDLKQYTLTTSHDMRAPVTTLIMAFDLLDTSDITNPETRGLIDVLKSTGKALRKTLDQSVDALKSAFSGEQQLAYVDVEQCLSGVLASIEAFVHRSGATVHTDFGGFRTVVFNRSFMDSIFLNLITNSIKYARPGVPPIISIRAEQAGGIKRLIVSDNGCGFDMEMVDDRIFGLHETFHDHPDSKGVGLYLVHSHVTRLGGTIAVESTVGEGTRFTISFDDEASAAAPVQSLVHKAA